MQTVDSDQDTTHLPVTLMGSDLSGESIVLFMQVPSVKNTLLIPGSIIPFLSSLNPTTCTAVIGSCADPLGTMQDMSLSGLELSKVVLVVTVPLAWISHTERTGGDSGRMSRSRNIKLSSGPKLSKRVLFPS